MTDQPPQDPTPEGTAIAERDWPYPWQRAFLDALARSPIVSDAAKIARVDYSWAYQVRRRDEDFRLAWDTAIEVGVDLLERVALTRATVGEPRRTVTVRRKLDAEGRVLERVETELTETHVNDTLLLATLRRYRPEQWGDHVQHRHTGADGGPVRVEVYRTPDRERLVSLFELAAEEAGIIDVEAVELTEGGDGGQDDVSS
jgi:hypothetical protein